MYVTTSLSSYQSCDLRTCLTGTQADQTRVDSEKKKKAMKELVTSWQDRLQLISIIVSMSPLSLMLDMVLKWLFIDNVLRGYELTGNTSTTQLLSTAIPSRLRTVK